MAVERKTPENWVWAYHATPWKAPRSIVKNGLKPTPHEAVDGMAVIFVEPDLEGVSAYYTEGMAVLRFKTPGFGTTEDGESVIFGGSDRRDAAPDLPMVGGPGEEGVIPPERIQVYFDKKFR